MGQDLGKTSTKLDANVAALLSYLLGFISGIAFFVIEKENKFVRFHAMQSIVLCGSLFVLQFVLMVIPFLMLLIPLINLAGLALAILCMVKAYQGERFKLPVVGDFAEKWSA